jgi:hypothetical protein
MKTHLIVLAAVFSAAIASADPYVIAKQRARGVVDQNNAEQARIQRGAADNQAADPALQATMQNITDLASDITAFTKADKVDPAQKASLMNNLTMAAQGKKAKSETLKKFAEDLSAAVAGNKKLTAANTKQLGTFVRAAFNGSRLTEVQIEKISVAAEKLLTDSGVAKESAATVAEGLKKIAAETK